MIKNDKKNRVLRYNRPTHAAGGGSFLLDLLRDETYRNHSHDGNTCENSTVPLWPCRRLGDDCNTMLWRMINHIRALFLSFMANHCQCLYPPIGWWLRTLGSLRFNPAVVGSLAKDSALLAQVTTVCASYPAKWGAQKSRHVASQGVYQCNTPYKLQSEHFVVKLHLFEDITQGNYIFCGRVPPIYRHTHMVVASRYNRFRMSCLVMGPMFQHILEAMKLNILARNS